MMQVLYEQSNYPILQNRVYGTREEAINCPLGGIRIVEDPQTGLIRNEAFRPQLMNYDSEYNNEQAFSLFFQSHLNSIVELIERTMGQEGLVEVGCGKGFFLEMLLGKGFDVTGFDPTYEGENPRVVKEYFRPGVLKPSKGLILRHVLEHVPDPFDFLCQLRDANGGSGLIYIEVPCFDWICEKRAWFDIFYEHVNYFRMSDFHKMFGRLLFSERTFGGQYLSIVGDLTTLRPPRYVDNQAIDFPDDFLESLTSVEQKKGKPTIIWGGASKGVIFSLLRERAGHPVEAVIDVNPAKQGKFLPVTGLKVMAPADAVSVFPKDSTVFVMNSNYIEEIKEMSTNRFNYIKIDQ